MSFVLALLLALTPRFSHGDSSHTEGQVECAACLDQNLSKDISGLERIESYLKTPTEASQCQDKNVCDVVIPWAQELSQKYPACAGYFIGKDGRIGSLGRMVSDQIINDIKAHVVPGDPKRSTSVFIQDYPDLNPTCPGFQKMTPAQKISFWGWFFEILGFLESSCNPAQLNKSKNVPHPPATGLYQLEPTPDLRSWRGPHCGVSAAAIRTAQANTLCALDVFSGLLKKNGRVFGLRNEKDVRVVTSYWESLNPLIRAQENNQTNKRYSELPHNRMLRYLSRFPLCQAPAQPATDK